VAPILLLHSLQVIDGTLQAESDVMVHENGRRPVRFYHLLKILITKGNAEKNVTISVKEDAVNKTASAATM
jgi:hypothetical protein